MNDCGIGAMDAMYLAIAIGSGAQIFLTTDDVMLYPADCITVKNPTEMA